MGICSIHFPDRFIKKFINENIKEAFCDYCDEERPSANFDELYQFIEDAVYSEYVEPYEASAPYDSEPSNYEDRFRGLRVHYKYDLIGELLDTFDYSIVEDIAASFPDDYLAARDQIWGPSKNEYFIGGWEKFKEIIKHKVRFLFFDPKTKTAFEDDYNESLNPAYVLDEVRKAIIELQLIIDIPKYNLNVYRSRQHKRSEFIKSAQDLGAPPPLNAQANRMSPAGISMFYGALDSETCQSEVLDSKWTNSAITTGEFINIKPLKVVDFTSVQEIPSLFDEANRHKRTIMEFILSFVQDLSIPVKPDNSVHIEYIPTQIVTEYIRIKLGADRGVQGILYYSVKNPGRKCLVIFADNEQIIDENQIANVDERHLIALLNDSIVSTLI